MTRPSWFGRAPRNPHRHAIEQATRRWRGGRRDDLARTRRKFDFHTGLGADPPQFIGRGVVGPAAEREFGTQQVAIVGVVVAVASALAHMAFGHSHSGQLGGSGVVSALILLNSLGAASSGRVPLTFLLTAVFWSRAASVKVRAIDATAAPLTARRPRRLSDEVQSILTRDGVSHAAHLAGALVGTAAGYAIHAGRGRAKRDPNRRVSDPFGRTRSAKKLR